MATIADKVKTLLTKRGMTASAFGRELGYVYGYQAFYDLFVRQSSPFTLELCERAAAILGVSPEFFEELCPVDQRRSAIVHREFEAFLAMPEIAHVDPDTLATVERIVFFGGRIPDRWLFRSLALTISGHWSDREISRSIAINAELESHPPIPEPPRPSPRKGRGKRKPREERGV